MKNILIMMCCACFLLGACDKAEVPSVYVGPDGINFYYDQEGPYDADPYPNSSKEGSLSSSQPTDTLWYKILIMGNVSDKERKFALKQSDLSASDSLYYYTGLIPQVKVAVPGVNYVAFDAPEMEKYYVIPPHSSEILVPVILIRDSNAVFASFSIKYRLHFEIVPNDEVKVLDPRFYRGTAKFTQWSF